MRCYENNIFSSNRRTSSGSGALLLIILIDCGIALKEVPLTPDTESGVHCSPPVDCESNAILVRLITAGSVKLLDWLIREAEETVENNIRGPIRKAIGNWDLMQRVNYQISLYPPHENKKIERVRKRYPWRSRKSRKNEGWHE